MTTEEYFDLCKVTVLFAIDKKGKDQTIVTRMIRMHNVLYESFNMNESNFIAALLSC
jgi:hypothetical protein